MPSFSKIVIDIYTIFLLVGVGALGLIGISMSLLVFTTIIKVSIKGFLSQITGKDFMGTRTRPSSYKSAESYKSADWEQVRDMNGNFVGWLDRKTGITYNETKTSVLFPDKKG